MSKSLRFSLLSFAALSCVSAVSTAKQVTIYRAGAPLTATYATLSSAITAAVPGDSLVLSADTFKEYNVSVGKSLVISGTIDKTDTTVINAQLMPASRVLSVVSGASVTLRDIIITGGNANAGLVSAGGGIYGAINTSVTLAGNLIVCYNRAKATGGGVSAYDLTLRDNARILANICDSLGGGVYANGNVATIGDNVTIVGNSANRGGGIYWHGVPVMSVMTIADHAMIGFNTATITGGGIHSMSNLVMNDHIWVGKNVSDFGGGIYTAGDPSIHLAATGQVMVDSNNAFTSGGAICNIATTIEMEGGQMVGNQATSGAAIYNASKNASAMDINVSVERTRIFNPDLTGIRQNEIFNFYDGGGAVNFASQACWWGQTDTTGLTITKPGNNLYINNWAVATWSINNNTPVKGLTSFPVKALMELNIGGALPAGVFPLLSGHYTADLGTFSADIDTIDASNEVISTYKSFLAPPDTSLVNFVVIIDGDTFKDSRMVTAATLSVKELEGLSAIKVYPNPAHDVLNIAEVADGSKAVVYDVTGKMVAESIVSASGSSISVGHLAAGNYILQITDPEGRKGAVRIAKQE